MWTRARSWFRILLGRDLFERGLSEELAFHLQTHADSLTRQGLTAAEARRRARLEFGNPESVKEEVREARIGIWCAQLGQDLNYSLRPSAAMRACRSASCSSWPSSSASRPPSGALPTSRCCALSRSRMRTASSG